MHAVMNCRVSEVFETLQKGARTPKLPDHLAAQGIALTQLPAGRQQP